MTPGSRRAVLISSVVSSPGDGEDAVIDALSYRLSRAAVGAFEVTIVDTMATLEDRIRPPVALAKDSLLLIYAVGLDLGFVDGVLVIGSATEPHQSMSWRDLVLGLSAHDIPCVFLLDSRLTEARDVRSAVQLAADLIDSMPVENSFCIVIARATAGPAEHIGAWRPHLGIGLDRLLRAAGGSRYSYDGITVNEFCKYVASLEPVG